MSIHGFHISYTMKPLVVLLVLMTTQLYSSDADSGCEKDIENKSPTLRLRRYLFCDYDRSVRPSIHHDNATTLNLRLLPKFIEFDDHANTLTLHSWMAIYWMDFHLTWNKTDFDGVDSIHVSTDDVWVPDIAVYNSGDMGYDQSGIPRTDCILMSSGMVLCVPAVKYITHCSGDYTYWPFDVQNCTIRIGSWAHTGEEIDFHLPQNGVCDETN